MRISNFFHGIINKKRKQQAIRGILIDGEWVDNPERVKREFFNHFANRYANPEWVRPSIDESFQKWLGDDHRLELEQDVSEVEIKKAVWDCGWVKSPGPDGFTFEFLKSFGRQVLDWPLILNEVISWCKARNGQALIFKVDFQKAYDLVCWDYLDQILEKFRFFFLASGLRVNVHKSSLNGLGVRFSSMQIMAECFGCVANKFPFTYLGAKIRDNMSRINSWQEVILKVSSKLSKWKAKTLFVGGRLTLIKSVLGAIPTYFMSLYKVPEAVLKHTERLRNSVSWGLSWKSERFRGCLGKWLWLKNNMEVCGLNGSLDEPIPRCTGGSVWVAIRKSIDTLKSKGVDLMQYCNKVIGNGRPRGGLEESQWNEMAQMLGTVSLSLAVDRWRWSLNGNGSFLVSSARKVIDKHLLDKLPTRSNLSYRGVDVPCVLCPVCDSEVESRNHLFFGCSLVSEIYRLIGRWWSIHIPLFSDFASWEAWFKDLRITSLHKSVLEATFFSLWWHVRSFRYASVFAVVKPKKCMLFNNTVSQTFMWMNHRSWKVRVN
nr:RNA-directed DNA polymerase, eukaryota, reverse transcriptase zinc-binding domain protein [Tanacetum cinerariifolium]